ncbi:hypothetical protein [Marinobacter sp.]|uniref:hypothetical protein n=1 Tax=Marinobacter sp. TaxID=50741 RepID=UPI003A92CBD8
MQSINLKGGTITLETSHKELEMLEVIIRAGHNTDPVFRHASDEENKNLHLMVSSLLDRVKEDTITFSMSQQELMSMSSIIEAVNTMDSEIYYPDMIDEFPSDDDLDRFTQHVSDIYDQAFSTNE